jgi:hypothetical protein
VEVLRLLISMGPIEMMPFQRYLKRPVMRRPLSTQPMICHPQLKQWCRPQYRSERLHSPGDVPNQPDHAGTLSVHQHQPACMLRDPSDEHDGGCHRCAEISDGNGAVYRPVGCLFHIYERIGRRRGRGAARHVTTLRQACVGGDVAIDVTAFPQSVKEGDSTNAHDHEFLRFQSCSPPLAQWSHDSRLAFCTFMQQL